MLAFGRPRRAAALRLAVAVLAIGAALWQLSLELRLFAGRCFYPFDIDWLESSALYQAYRHGHFQYTYRSPDTGYMALFHPPGYPMLLGMLGRVVGLDYPMARGLSLLFFLGMGALLVREACRHRSDDRLGGWVDGALIFGCLAAAVPLCGSYFDLVREDTLSMLLCVLLASRAMPPRWTPWRITVFASLVMAIVFTRLPAVFMPMWVVIFVFVRDRRAGVRLAVASVAACGLGLVAMLFESKGWYWFLTISVLAKHAVSGARALEALELLLRFAPFLVIISVLTVALAVTRRLSARSALWFGLLLASMPAGLLPYAKYGGFINDVMPFCVFYAPVTLFVLADAVRALPVGAAFRARVGAGYQLLLAGFLVARTWDPSAFLPSNDQWRRARLLNERVRDLATAGVLVPRHPFLPIRHDPATRQFSEMPYMDLRWARFELLDVGRYIDRTRARNVLVGGNESDHTAGALSARFQVSEPLREALGAVLGDQTPLRWLMTARDDDSQGHVLFDFESPLEGWTMEGDAFVRTPVTAAVPRMMPIQGHAGRKLACSYHPDKGDAATGTLRSPEFLIDRPKLAVRVGGSIDARTRVELRVDGRALRRQSAIFDQVETLTTVVWDVSSQQGRHATLWLVDESEAPWGHLLVDHGVLY
ncbi:MAG: hypothetical protein WKG00_12625 [Polyangiaceae bacterium]